MVLSCGQRGQGRDRTGEEPELRESRPRPALPIDDSSGSGLGCGILDRTDGPVVPGQIGILQIGVRYLAVSALAPLGSPGIAEPEHARRVVVANGQQSMATQDLLLGAGHRYRPGLAVHRKAAVHRDAEDEGIASRETSLHRIQVREHSLLGFHEALLGIGVALLGWTLGELALAARVAFLSRVLI